MREEAKRLKEYFSSATLKLLEAVRSEVGGEILSFGMEYDHGILNGIAAERRRLRSLLDEAIISIKNNNK